VWSGLGVPEVWLWRQGRLEVYLLEVNEYVQAERSRLLPDLELLVSFLTRARRRRSGSTGKRSGGRAPRRKHGRHMRPSPAPSQAKAPPRGLSGLPQLALQARPELVEAQLETG
jgi:hypothetical protein